MHQPLSNPIRRQGLVRPLNIAMKLKPIFVLPIIFALVLTLCIPVLLLQERGFSLESLIPTRPAEEIRETEPEETEAPTEEATEEATEEVTEAPTEEPTEAPTEKKDDPFFTLTFVGDCTFGSTAANWELASSFVQVVGEDYRYPFANVVDIFENDDFTLANLEGPLTEEGVGEPLQKEFVFRGSPAYTAILTENSVEAVTLANNHALDYGFEGRNATKDALKEAGIAHGAREQSFLYTTDSGLTVGVYCDDFAFDRAHITDSIASLREQGAEIVICAFHWGQEQEYQPAQNEIDWGHIAIDAGADIVAGHHPHVLQPIEYYKNGVIFYSLGNFSFGGNANPGDTDSVILQQEVFRDPDGTMNLGELKVIPCSITSTPTRTTISPGSWKKAILPTSGSCRSWPVLINNQPKGRTARFSPFAYL